MATIGFNTLLKQLALPKYFSLSFEIYGVALAPSIVVRNNIFDIKDSTSGVSLFSLSTTEGNYLRVIYGGYVYFPYGPAFISSQQVGGWTTIGVRVGPNELVLSTTAETTVYTTAVPSPVETAGVIYNLFTSNSYETSAGGNLRNFYIQGE